MNNIKIGILYENTLKISLNISIDIFSRRKLKLKLLKFKKVDNMYLYRFLNVHELKDIIKFFEIFAEVEYIDIVIGKEVYDYIDTNSLNIKQYQEVGKKLKNTNFSNNKEFIEFYNTINTEMSRKLYQNQAEVAYHSYKVKRSMNFSVPGSGKTSMVYGLFAYLNSGKMKKSVERVVVFCPKNAFKAWRDEFVENYGTKKKLKLLMSEDRNKNIESELLAFSKEYNLILINYEKIKSLSNYIEGISTEQTLFVFDEIHRIKNYDGVYGTSIRNSIRTNGYMVALTGTPMPNGHKDLENMLKILFRDDFNLMNFSKFNFKNLKDEQKKIINEEVTPFFSRINKQDLELPSYNQDIIYNIKLTPIEKESIEIILNKKYNPLVSLIRINQVLSVPRRVRNYIQHEDIECDTELIDDILNNHLEDYELGKINSITISTKMMKLLELVSTLFREEKSLIIWCQYIDTMNEINYILNRKGISSFLINGKIENWRREELINDFNNGCFKVLIANPQTLAESVSLHKVCHDAIYFEINYDLTKFLQSKDRIHRLGLEKNQYTQYYYFNCELTTNNFFEEKILERLMKKEEEMLKFLNSEKYIYESVQNNSKFIENIIKEVELNRI